MFRRLRSAFQLDSLKGRLLRGGIAMLLIRVGGILAMLASSVVLARALGVEAFGVYSLAFSIMTLIAIPVHVGLPTLVLRETASADLHGDLGLMKGIWLWSTRFVLIASALVVSGGLILWLAVPGLVSAPLAVSFLLIPLIAFAGLRGAALKGLRRIAWSMLPGNILRPGALVLLVLLFLWIRPDGFAPVTAMWLHVAASVFAFAVGVWLVMLSQPAGLSEVPADTSRNRAWLAALGPMALVGGLQIVNQNAGVVVLGAVDTEAEVGLFRVALAASSMLLFGLQIVTPLFEPYFVRFHQSADKSGLQRMATNSAIAGFVATLPIALMFIVGGEWLVSLLYGAEFRGAYPALLVLVLGQLLRVYFGSSETILMLTGQEKQGMFIWGAAIVLGLALAVPLSQYYGATGAAVAASVVLVLVRLAQWWAVLRKTGVDTALHAHIFRRAV